MPKPTKMLPFGDGIAMLQYASGLGTDSEANAPSSADYDDDSQAGQKRRCKVISKSPQFPKATRPTSFGT